jgi:two-component system alkaline phosphatase synthesis response regulator PhoP
MSRAAILLVEDEPGLVMTIGDLLRADGYSVDLAQTYAEGRAAMQATGLDLIILDLMLPGGSGLDLLRDLRAAGHSTPVLVLTARATVPEKVVGLKLGADDYLGKPFDSMELLARVEAVIRRAKLVGVAGDNTGDHAGDHTGDHTGDHASGSISGTATGIGGARVSALTNPRTAHPDTSRLLVGQDSCIRFDDIEVDVNRSEVRRAGAVLALTVQEYRLLVFFAHHPGRTLSRERLLDEVWGYGSDVTSRTVDVHVSSLRQKLGDDPTRPRWIVTVRGFGYRFEG